MYKCLVKYVIISFLIILKVKWKHATILCEIIICSVEVDLKSNNFTVHKF